MAGPVLAVDIGGSKCAIALVAGGALHGRRRAPTPATEGPEAVVTVVVRLALEAIADAPIAPSALGAACAGLVQDGCGR